jgi:hypothetical protein
MITELDDMAVGEQIISTAEMLYKELQGGGYDTPEIVVIASALMGCGFMTLLEEIPPSKHPLALGWIRSHLRSILLSIKQTLSDAELAAGRLH